MRGARPSPRSTSIRGATALFLLSLGATMSFGWIAESRGTMPPSDRFWSGLSYRTSGSVDEDSLEDLTASSELIVVGRLSRLTVSRTWVVDPDAGPDGVAMYVKAAIEEPHVLGAWNDTAPPSTVEVEFFVPNPRRLEQLVVDLPSDMTLFFLDRKQEPVTELFKLHNLSQSYFRGLDGVEVPIGAEDDWVLSLHGTNFEELVRRVSAATE